MTDDLTARLCPRCGSENLLPVSDCQTPPTLALACEQCGEIEGNAPTLAEAVTNLERHRARDLTGCIHESTG